jgi:hypothetical protein
MFPSLIPGFDAKKSGTGQNKKAKKRKKKSDLICPLPSL